MVEPLPAPLLPPFLLAFLQGFGFAGDWPLVPFATCTTHPSCRLLPEPIVMLFTSPEGGQTAARVLSAPPSRVVTPTPVRPPYTPAQLSSNTMHVGGEAKSAWSRPQGR